jgi:hypothetical protein
MALKLAIVLNLIIISVLKIEICFGIYVDLSKMGFLVVN